MPTIVKGLNEHQIGDILRLALEYIDCSSGIEQCAKGLERRIYRHLGVERLESAIREDLLRVRFRHERRTIDRPSGRGERECDRLLLLVFGLAPVAKRCDGPKGGVAAVFVCGVELQTLAAFWQH